VADIYLADKLKEPEGKSTAAAEAASVTLSEEEMKPFTGTYRNGTIGTLRRIALKEGKLRIDSFGASSTELNALGGGRFRPAGATSTLEFAPAASSGAARPSVTILREGQKPERLDRVEPFTPNPAELSAFTGSYSSDELDVSYEIALDGDKLTVRVKNGRPRPLQPAFRDAFASQGIIIEFQRDAKRRVAGFSVQAGRVRNITFRKM
jgi:hypothetical protein